MSATILPPIVIECQDGSTEMRAAHLIRGISIRKGATETDGCVVLVAGEGPIISKTPAIQIVGQIKSCIHWAAVREMDQAMKLQEDERKRQLAAGQGVLVPDNRLVVPGR